MFLTFSKVHDSIQQKILTYQQIRLNQLEIKEKEEKLKRAEERSEALENNNVQYTVQYIIDNPTEESDETDIQL